MTLLSNTFVATPSTTTHTVTRSVAYSPIQSTSTSTSATVDGPTPSQVLAMTIRKKRKVLRNKDRSLRVEILLTSTIRRLCQEIGDHLRARRIAGTKRKSPSSTSDDGENDDSSTPTVRHCPKRSHIVAEEKDDRASRKEEFSMTKKRKAVLRLRKAVTLPVAVH